MNGDELEADPLGLFLIQAARKFAANPDAFYRESFTGEYHRALTAASGAHKAAHTPPRPKVPTKPKKAAKPRTEASAATIRARANAAYKKRPRNEKI